MANKELLYGSESLANDDRVLYVEVSPGVYVQAMAPVALPSDISVEALITNTTLVINDGLYHARLGRNVGGWVNDYIAGAAGPHVLQNGPIVGPGGPEPGIYYNLQEGTQVMFTQFFFGISTVNDDCHFEIVWTDGPGGTGNIYPISAHRHVFTGAAIAGFASHNETIEPPAGPYRYSDGVRSITARVDPNDATCQITVAWHGWWEPE